MIPLRSLVATWTLVSIVATAPLRAQAIEPDEAALRDAARQLPIGATVTVRTRDGQRLRAVLFGVDAAGIAVKPATRIPVASFRIPYERLAAIERDEGRIRFGRWVGIGAAIGGALLFGLLAAAAAANSS